MSRSALKLTLKWRRCSIYSSSKVDAAAAVAFIAAAAARNEGPNKGLATNNVRDYQDTQQGEEEGVIRLVINMR